ncbi:hypothetical protein SASPL_114137 [Salvia splendens]|uniref:Heat stress transcription factor n=1 Tax=Salvia splendens TaxID=180675 RepID=A0A8X9A1R2_SALSN|nr:heat stress transcription factor A-4c-like [Salvia splendens]KAG6423734.1 hypothetical protein SASPL_114137 [Salvia splendens]
MDGSNGSSWSPAPFLVKTYEMVDDPMTNSVVSWSLTGHSFVVWNPPEFARDLLPKYFKHNNFSSFIRQLNTYGFRKTDPDQWEFANDEFIRGQKHLLKNIYRRKPIHSHSGPGNVAPLTDSEREHFEKEIQQLKGEKVMLQSEVERRRHESQGYEHQLNSLRQILQNIDHRQRQLMISLAQLLEKPSTMEQPGFQSKKRRSTALHFLQGEGLENSGALSLPFMNLEQVEEIDSSLNFWEKFIHGVEAPAEGFHDFRLHPTRSPVITASSADSDNASRCCHMSASTSRDCNSSPELAASSTYLGSPEISSICIDLDSRLKPVGIDVNMSPTKTHVHRMPKDQEQDGAIPSVAAGLNDVFWQQFLTEAPGSSTAQEVKSEEDSGS